MGDDFQGAAAMNGPTNLGNFKGVMLCNRPSDNAPARVNDGKGAYKSPFEHLGLPPCKRDEAAATAVKKRGPSAALRQHVRWLRELQDQMRGEREQVAEEEKQSEEKKQRMRAAIEKHRSAVREMMEERDRVGEEQYKQQVEAKRNAQSSSKPSALKEGGGKAKVAAKPLWAMTAQEKEDFEDDEADNLIDFAENLDFDKYVGDLEFREGLQALQDRAGRLQKEQDAFKDALVRDFNAKVEDEEATTSAGSPRSLRLEDGVDGQSLLGDLKSEYSTSSRRTGREDRRDRGLPDWDASTNCGDEPRQVDRGLKDAAQSVLESNSQIRAVHSKESVQRIIEKARERTQQPPPPADIYECMRRDGPMPVPVITSSEDTQQRLQKSVDPSQLPYLYRSPAI